MKYFYNNFLPSNAVILEVVFNYKWLRPIFLALLPVNMDFNYQWKIVYLLTWLVLSICCKDNSLRRFIIIQKGLNLDQQNARAPIKILHLVPNQRKLLSKIFHSDASQHASQL